MFSTKDLELKKIDHLGIVAGIVDSIGIVEIINNLVGSEPGEKVSAGQVVKAMILNGLSMMSQPLYMFPKFFELIACEHLIGVGVKAEYLNDDKLGRVLDKLFIKGLDTVFLAVSLNAVEIYQISLSSSHLDSTSFHVHGEYENSLPSVIFEDSKESGSLEKENEESQSPQAIKLTYGYSRDHRPDLKQFITQLVCSGDGDIPIYIKAVSGNEVDSKKFGEIAVEYQKRIQVDSLIVADSALYTESNIKLMSSLKWLTRVPLTIKSAKNLVMSLAESEFVKSEKAGYSYAEKKITYGDIEQRWLIVQSQDRKKSDLKKLSKRIEKALTNTQSKLKNLSQEKFACAADARKELTKISKEFKYHQVENIEVIEKSPKIKEENQSKYYQILATVVENKDTIEQEMSSAGRFIIATNVLSEKELSKDKMLSEYKAQQSCERGFSFLKNPLFLADSIFLKSPERIEALAMIMGLCLLVYTLAQREIRAALKSLNYTVKNQLGKAINNPTMRWIFQCFQSVHLVTFQGKREFYNLTSEMKYILLFLPEACRNYYRYIS
ncbi:MULTISPECIES: IS1634 family transposase [Nostocales]|uniref:IS1634 family transposase n=1 Tax=Dolichospermum flos-aquae UHCC 0037 TaxID=2590026 RepID=A0ACC7S962_DOLFA|nr:MULTISPECIES: IS1634 family transposase [Nostocales]ALB40682.1 transposase [Anabaena sp. WA102]ALB42199.1 transposase [Anabaena sp. WA102]ALB42402.1 transposase [Anabaena sp. WA102]MBO1065263.1 IS1634 family transposase [Anabaena sp. 54]MBO1065516.1 IS1634 family transposase [Anabaena sp. 54]